MQLSCSRNGTERVKQAQSSRRSNDTDKGEMSERVSPGIHSIFVDLESPGVEMTPSDKVTAVMHAVGPSSLPKIALVSIMVTETSGSSLVPVEVGVGGWFKPCCCSERGQRLDRHSSPAAPADRGRLVRGRHRCFGIPCLEQISHPYHVKTEKSRTW